MAYSIPISNMLFYILSNWYYLLDIKYYIIPTQYEPPNTFSVVDVLLVECVGPHHEWVYGRAGKPDCNVFRRQHSAVDENYSKNIAKMYIYIYIYIYINIYIYKYT